MDKEVIRSVKLQFSHREAAQVLSELQKISLSSIASRSEKNLLNAHLAILKLAEGDLQQVSYYVGCARKDFRDVIYWAGKK